MIFVLVHGIHDTCLKFSNMKAAFEGQGHRCIVPSLTPNNAGKGLEYLARQLSDIINAEIADNAPQICLVGFSMGGLISRYYLQELDGHKIVSHFFSVSAPHHGSILGYLSSSLGAKQMRPNSDFLQALEKSEAYLQKVACYSYWTPFDLMILPATSSIWDKAENIRVLSPCHPMMVTNHWIIADILDKLDV